MRIALVNPPCYGENFHISGISGCRWSSLSPNTINKEPLKTQKDYYYAIFPFPLAFASTILKSQGHTARVFDFLNLNISYGEMYEILKEFNPDKIYLESCNVSYNQDIQILENIKEFMNIPVCMVGSVVRQKKGDIPKGIEYIEGNYLQTLGGENYVDLLTMPDRDDSVLLYNDYHSFAHIIKKPQLQVWSSIGCKFNCSFCSWRWNVYDGKVAYRKIEHIRDEIKYAVEKWGIKSVLLDDDTVNMNDDRTKELVKMINKDLKGLQFSAMVRADSCSLDTFKAMKDAGFVSLKVGVETFSPSVLKKIGKGLESAELLERILKLWDMGYFMYLSTMSHILGETEQEREETNIILKELGTLGIKYQRPMAVPLPGTKMGKEFQEWELRNFGDVIPDFDYGKYDGSGELMKRIMAYSKGKQ